MSGRQFGEHLRRFRAAYVALVISSMMTAAAVLLLRRSAHEQEQLWLNAVAQEVSDRAKDRIEPYLGFLRGVRGLFLGSVSVEAEEFGRFVAVQAPQLRALGAAVYAPASDGVVRIEYVEPADRRAELVGLDLMADPHVRVALQRASRSGGPVATTGPTLWIVLYLPPPPSPPEPRPSIPMGTAGLPGYAAVQLRGDVLWHELVAGPRRATVGYQLFEVTASGAIVPKLTQGKLERADSSIETTIALQIAQSSWLLRLVADRHAVDSTWWLPWVAAVAGALASGTLFTLMCTQIAARRSAERLTQLRDEFLSAAAHELKTPVTAIKGFSQLLRDWDLEHVQRRGGAALASIERQADRIGRLVQEMLEASRLQRQELALSMQPIELSGMVQTVVDDLRASFPAHQVVCTYEGRTTVLADRGRIEQVVANLLANAARFSPKGGEIRVSVREVGDRVVTSVQDFGIGIPADRQRDMFERYYQAHRGTPYEAIGGLGLGLYVSKEIVNAHAGRIWFESIEGKGTTFSFSLPASKEARP